MTTVHETASCQSDPPEAKRPRMAETGDGDSTPSWIRPTLPNPHLHALDSDFLYHIGYSRDELRDIFGDVKFVVMGGAAGRMGGFAERIAREIGHPKVEKEELKISKTDRFALFKIGPVLSVSHGMGVPSVSILLHEIFKLLHYAGVSDAIIIRIGTSGGIGIPPGTVVVTDKAFNAFLEQEHQTVILGEVVSRPTVMDQDLVRSVLSCQDDHSFQTILGGTMCTDDFYEGQGRLDGSICEFTEEKKLSYLQKVHKAGVVNIEMECTALAALSHKAGIKCAVVCVALLDRLQGDQVVISPEDYQLFQSRPQSLVAKFIKSRLNPGTGSS